MVGGKSVIRNLKTHLNYSNSNIAYLMVVKMTRIFSILLSYSYQPLKEMQISFVGKRKR